MPEWTGAVLEGDLVRLEPLGPQHLEGLWSASRDPRVWRWLPVVQPETLEEMRAWLDDALRRAESGLDIPFATVHRGEVAGSTRFLVLRPEHGVVEIGWTWIRPKAWGTGANLEAKLLQLRHAFEAWGCRRVELKTDALNEPARRSMESWGAVLEGVHRKHMLVRGGENRDSAWYAVTDDDWPRVQELLLTRLRAAAA